MEIQKQNSSLQQKLQLLRTLRSGKLEQSEKILESLSRTARTNSQLYAKFHSFLLENRKDIQDIEQQQKLEEQKVVLVEGSDDDWQTDDSVSIESEKQQHETVLGVRQSSKETKSLIKNISNSKSTTLLYNIKEVKKPFFVQTAAKQSKSINSRASLTRKESLSKIQIQNRSLLTTLSKTNLLAQNLPRKASRPYFPPINGTKSTLKLQIK